MIHLQVKEFKTIDELNSFLKKIGANFYNLIVTELNDDFWYTVLYKEINRDVCGCCGQVLTEIRGRHPGDERRKVCACCTMEKVRKY